MIEVDEFSLSRVRFSWIDCDLRRGSGQLETNNVWKFDSLQDQTTSTASIVQRLLARSLYIKENSSWHNVRISQPSRVQHADIYGLSIFQMFKFRPHVDEATVGERI
eukprot:s468_g23.t1